MRKRSKYDLPATLEEMTAYTQDLRYRNSPLYVNRITYLHFHRQIELGLCIEGEGICRVGNSVMPYKAGDVQLILPYQTHINSNKDGASSTWRWLFFSPRKLLSALGVTDVTHLTDRLQTNVAAWGILSGERFPKTCRAIKKLFDADQEALASPYAEERLALDCYHVMLSLLEESAPYPKLSFDGEGVQRMSDIAPALRRIQKDLTEGGETSIQELAELCHCSPPHLRRMFHATLNASPKEYLIACRIRRAKLLLDETNESILSVAMSVGYRDVSGFNRSFMKIVGESPSSYRMHARHT